jgi:hypothetical protein
MAYELTTTFDAYTDPVWIKKNITDLRFENRPLWEAATKGSLAVTSEDGHQWKIRLAYGKTNNTKPFDDDTDLLTDANGVAIRRAESGTMAYGEYVYYSNAIILGEITDDLEQKGDAQLEKLIDDEVFKVRDDMFHSLYTALFGTGVLAKTNASLKTLTSIHDMLNAGTYEGIQRAGTFTPGQGPWTTNQWWMPTAGSCTGTTDLIWSLKQWIKKAADRNKGKKFSVIFANEDMIKILWDLQTAKQGMILPWVPTKDDLDWLAEFAISKVPIVQEDNIPDNELWGLEYGTFRLLDKIPFKLDPWEKQQHYSRIFTTMKWGGQLVSNNPGGNGTFTYTP